MDDHLQPPRRGATSEATVNAFYPREMPTDADGSGRTAREPPPPSDPSRQAELPSTTFGDFPHWYALCSWLEAMSQTSSTPVIDNIPEHHSAQTARTVCHHLGIGLIEAGIRLLLSPQTNKHMEKVEWMLHPTLFPALWAVSQYSLDVQPILDKLDPRYLAWRLTAAANGELFGPHQTAEQGAHTLAQLRYREEVAEDSCCEDSGSGYRRKKRQRQQQQRAASS